MTKLTAGELVKPFTVATKQKQIMVFLLFLILPSDKAQDGNLKQNPKFYEDIYALLIGKGLRHTTTIPT